MIIHYNSINKEFTNKISARNWIYFNTTFSRRFIEKQLDNELYNINKWNINFSNQPYTLVDEFNKDYLQKQENDFLETCLITAIYNAYQFLFNNQYANAKKLARHVKNNNFDDPEWLVAHINKLFKRRIGGKIIKIVTKNILNVIKRNIDKNNPIVLSFSDNNDKHGHAVTIYGYNDDYLLVHDSGNDYLIKMLMHDAKENEWKTLKRYENGLVGLPIDLFNKYLKNFMVYTINLKYLEKAKQIEKDKIEFSNRMQSLTHRLSKVNKIRIKIR